MARSRGVCCLRQRGGKYYSKFGDQKVESGRIQGLVQSRQRGEAGQVLLLPAFDPGAPLPAMGNPFPTEVSQHRADRFALAFSAFEERMYLKSSGSVSAVLAHQERLIYLFPNKPSALERTAASAEKPF